MGLNITVYTNVKTASPQPEGGMWADVDRDHMVYAFISHEDFSQSLRGLKPDTWYEGDYYNSFSAGSYGGYNRLRDILSQMALGVPIEVVWDNLDQYRDKSFFELLNFADNEGTMGPEAVADLAQDFRDFEKQANMSDLWHFVKWYQGMKKVFEVASAHHGIVKFH